MSQLHSKSPTIFERNRSVNFAGFDPEFQRALRALTIHHDTKGGLPLLSTTYRGFPLGRWVNQVQQNPHSLSESQRAVLLSIPGFRLHPRKAGVSGLRPVDPERTKLWERVRAWAYNPMDDRVYRNSAAAIAVR